MRISASEARKLGLLKGASKIKKTNNPLKKNKLKGGRVKRADSSEDWRIEFAFGLEPHVKSRARTFVDERTVASAFKQASGDVKRFMALVRQRSVTPKETRDFERAVGLYAKSVMAGRDPIAVPVHLEMFFIFQDDADVWPVGVHDGDLTNLIKAVEDGMNAIAYTDDRNVVGVASWKLCGPESLIKVVMRPADAVARPTL